MHHRTSSMGSQHPHWEVFLVRAHRVTCLHIIWTVCIRGLSSACIWKDDYHHVNPFRAECPLTNMTMCFDFLSFLKTAMAYVVEFHPCWRKRPIYCPWLISYDCWWPGDASVQSISSQRIDLVIRKYSYPSNRRVCYSVTHHALFPNT